MRMSDLSSDVCSSDLEQHQRLAGVQRLQFDGARGLNEGDELGVEPGEAATAAVEQLITRPAKARWLHNALDLLRHAVVRSAARRVGKACVGTCSTRRSPYT